MTAKRSKILVTGSDGFIGSHLVEHLLEEGNDLQAFVYYNSFNSWGWLDTLPAKINNSLDVFAGDIRDPHGVRKAMTGCDDVTHLAALIGIPYSYHSPDTYIDTNIKGTLNVLQAARELGVKRVLHTSASKVYGTARFVPITEKHPLQGQSPYSASKIGADKLALSFYASFGTPVTIVRPFNTYGPRRDPHDHYPHRSECQDPQTRQYSSDAGFFFCHKHGPGIFGLPPVRKNGQRHDQLWKQF